MKFKRMIIDGHNDTMAKIIDEKSWKPLVNINRGRDLHIDLEKLRKGGLSTAFFAAFSQGDKTIEKSLSRTLSILNALYYTEEKNRDELKIVGDLREIERAYEEGLIGALPSIEGAYFIDQDNYYYILYQLRSLGIRLLGFNWNYSNGLGEGVARVYPDQETRSRGGLTSLGQESLERLEELGILIDLSHMNEESFWDIMARAKNPVVASHSGAYSLRPHRRNLKDDQLVAIAENGGLVGLVLCSSFLREDSRATIEDYLDHIDYVVELIGLDHVGLGSDFDGASLVEGINDVSDLNKIVEGLEARGYSQEDMDKILYKNYLRLLERAEKSSIVQKNNGPRPYLSLDFGQEIENYSILKMGLEDYRPGLDYKILLDGKLVSSGDLEGSSISYRLDLRNQEKFHIISFLVGPEEEMNIASRIFYLRA